MKEKVIFWYCSFQVMKRSFQSATLNRHMSLVVVVATIKQRILQNYIQNLQKTCSVYASHCPFRKT